MSGDWSDWFGGDDSAGWSDYAPQASSAVSDSVDWSSLVPQTETYGFDPYASPQFSAQDVAQEPQFYGQGQFYGPPSDLATNQSGSGIWATLQQAGNALETPGGKLGAGLFGAGVSAYGAKKQAALNESARKKAEAMRQQRLAQSLRFNEKANVGALRQAVAAPQQRGGESVFFNDNKLPVYAAEGGGISEEDWMRMQEENNQGILDARMDKPSAMGFLRYLYNGKRMPSEIAASARAQRPDVISERNRAIREAARYGEDQPVVQRAAGGVTNYVQGGTPGQADQIPAQLSDGEYVMDADVVSALGDGNNAAGAKKLDQMREGIRAHKRSAPVNKIPPKAKSPLAYMKKGK